MWRSRSQSVGPNRDQVHKIHISLFIFCCGGGSHTRGACIYRPRHNIPKVMCVCSARATTFSFRGSLWTYNAALLPVMRHCNTRWEKKKHRTPHHSLRWFCSSAGKTLSFLGGRARDRFYIFSFRLRWVASKSFALTELFRFLACF